MKNYKGFTTFLALIITVLPVISFADGTYYYGGQGTYIEEAAPVRTTGVIIPQKNSSYVVTESAPVYNNGTTVSTTNNTNTTNNTAEDIFGIHIKTKAEKDAEKAAQAEADRKAADAASVARNNDGSFAYGYTNGNGAQYTSGAKYLDARGNTNVRYTAAAGNAGSGFLPTTFGGWVIAILLMSVLVAIVRAFRAKFAAKPHVISHAHGNHA